MKDDLRSGRSLSRWEEDARGLSRRRSGLEKFVAKIENPNPRPKKRPKVVVRPPKFRPGDCLSVGLENGRYGAALVLATNHSQLEYGRDFVGTLYYMSVAKPPLRVFRERKWLHLTHHSWQNELDLGWYMHVGFRARKDRLEVVGQVELLESDPKPRDEGIPFCAWGHLGQQTLLQRAWDDGER